MNGKHHEPAADLTVCACRRDFNIPKRGLALPLGIKIFIIER